eukprot:4871455-Amphidinium_carterae.1
MARLILADVKMSRNSQAPSFPKRSKPRYRKERKWKPQPFVDQEELQGVFKQQQRQLLHVVA